MRGEVWAAGAGGHGVAAAQAACMERACDSRLGARARAERTLNM